MDYKDEFIKDMDRMYKKMKRIRKKIRKDHIIKLIPLVIAIVLACVFIYTLTNRLEPNGFTVNNANLTETIIIILCFFAFKALTMFVISPVLIYGLTGVMFDTHIALAVLFAGLFIELLVNYLMGRFLGRIYVERLINRFDDEGKFIEKLKHLHNNKINIFFMRFIGMPPISITSVYLAAYELKFSTYFIYSMLGMLPKAIIVTVAGTSVRDPGSPMFMASVAALLILGVVVFLISRFKKT